MAMKSCADQPSPIRTIRMSRAACPGSTWKKGLTLMLRLARPSSPGRPFHANGRLGGLLRSGLSRTIPAMEPIFPGMDPYLESTEVWPDFHDSFLFCIREALQPVLPQRYYAQLG